MLKKIFLLCLLSLTTFSGVAFANANVSSSSLTNGTFNVRDVLSLPDTSTEKDVQPQAYFNDKERAPIESVIIQVFNFALTIMGSIAIILLIIAGLRMMAAGGESQKIDEAKEMIKFAIIGLVVAFSSYIIVIFVQSLFEKNG